MSQRGEEPLGTRVYETSSSAVSCELGEGQALLDLDRGVYYSLNQVGGVVWALLQKEPQSIDGVVQSIVAGFKVDPAECKNDITKLFAELATAGLIKARNG